jgi:DNA-directed RNA polymerase specialized sigma24 family protein
MSHEMEPRLLSLVDLAEGCARESDRFFSHQPHDPCYCFELFRRAIFDRNQRSWELIYAQYRRLLINWVLRHPDFAASGEDAEYFVNGAYEKMWAALTPSKFAHFPDLKSLLRYLQMCVHSVIVDHNRLNAHAAVASELADKGVPGGVAPRDHDQPLAGLQREEFWRCLDARLSNEKERRVIYGLFVLGFKPRELYDRWRESFRDVAEIYRVRENVIERLRRDYELKKMLDDDA